MVLLKSFHWHLDCVHRSLIPVFKYEIQRSELIQLVTHQGGLNSVLTNPIVQVLAPHLKVADSIFLRCWKLQARQNNIRGFNTMPHISVLLLPLANEVWGKVTFSQLSVCPMAGGVSSLAAWSHVISRGLCPWSHVPSRGSLSRGGVTDQGGLGLGGGYLPGSVSVWGGLCPWGSL